MRTITMKPAEWADIPDNPIQRDSAQHARKYNARGGHLSKPFPTHSKLTACELPSGRMFKVDGHSRSWLWDNWEVEGQPQLEPPEELSVDIYPAANMKEVKKLYQAHDSDGSVERGTDKIFGAFASHNFHPRKPYMFTATGTLSALRVMAFPGRHGDDRVLSIYDLVDPWMPTVKIIDQLEPFFNHNFFPAYVQTAMFMTIKKDGEFALSFWQAYHDDAGTKKEQSVNGVFAARLYTYQNIHDPMKKIRGYGGIRRHTPVIIYCYEQWAKSKRIKITKNISTDNFRKSLPPLTEWWRDNIGDYFYPIIRSKKKADAAEAAIEEANNPKPKKKVAKKKAAKK